MNYVNTFDSNHFAEHIVLPLPTTGKQKVLVISTPPKQSVKHIFGIKQVI